MRTHYRISYSSRGATRMGSMVVEGIILTCGMRVACIDFSHFSEKNMY